MAIKPKSTAKVEKILIHINFMTFKEIYNREKTKLTPCQNFIKEVAEVTRKSENTVRTWISGAVVPDELTKKVLAAHFGVPEDEIFRKEKCV